jgi:cytochrome P450
MVLNSVKQEAAMDAPIGPAEPVLVGSERPPDRARWRLRRPDDRQNALPSIIAAAYEQPIVRQSTPVGAFHLVADPEGIRRVMLDNVANYPKTRLERRFFSSVFGDGLLSSEGEVWRSHRRIMAPSFSPASVTSYVPAMAEQALALDARWGNARLDQPIDVAREMNGLTLRIISQAMFSTDGDALTGLMERSIAGAMTVLRPGLADFIPVIDRIRYRALTQKVGCLFAELDAAIAELIARREGAGGDDLLARLIAARDAERGRGMTAQEVRDQVLTIFVAGHETTAAAMAWIWYLLSQHHWAEARLHAEFDAVLGGRAPAQEDLPRLVYTRMVAEEAMRLYPPAPGTSTRVAIEADEVCGMKIPKGGYVVIAP